MMWYPNERILVPVTIMTLSEQNARMLEVEYKKPVFPWNDKNTAGQTFSAEQLRQLQQIKDRFSHEYFTSEKYAGKGKQQADMIDEEEKKDSFVTESDLDGSKAPSEAGR